jgi:hypothetical protein
MCSILAGLSALFTIGSGMMQYQAQQEQARAQERAYLVQAENERRQAELAQQNANVEAKKQEIAADNYARQGKELRDRRRLAEGQQRAQTGAAGIAFSGSSLDLLSAGRDAYAEDQITLLNNQRNENYGYRVNQMNYLNDKASFLTAADNAEMDAAYARRVGKQQGLATILGTATSVIGGLAGSFGGGGSSGGTTKASGSGTGGGYSFGSINSNMGFGTTSNFSGGKYSFSRTPYTRYF